jgi:hypothetical protein
MSLSDSSVSSHYLRTLDRLILMVSRGRLSEAKAISVLRDYLTLNGLSTSLARAGEVELRSSINKAVAKGK